MSENKINRLKYPLNINWHRAINQFNQNSKDGDWRHWMYEAKTMADEIPRMAQLFKMEREDSLPKTHQQCSHSQTQDVPENHLTCCRGVKCKECPELQALNIIENATPEEIDLVKAWTCAAHIVGDGGDVMREGYILRVDDRMFWDNIYGNLMQDEHEKP
jgi:hypothetical protein